MSPSPLQLKRATQPSQSVPCRGAPGLDRPVLVAGLDQLCAAREGLEGIAFRDSSNGKIKFATAGFPESLNLAAAWTSTGKIQALALERNKKLDTLDQSWRRVSASIGQVKYELQKASQRLHQHAAYSSSQVKVASNSVVAGHGSQEQQRHASARTMEAAAMAADELSVSGRHVGQPRRSVLSASATAAVRKCPRLCRKTLGDAICKFAKCGNGHSSRCAAGCISRADLRAAFAEAIAANRPLASAVNEEHISALCSGFRAPTDPTAVELGPLADACGIPLCDDLYAEQDGNKISAAHQYVGKFQSCMVGEQDGTKISAAPEAAACQDPGTPDTAAPARKPSSIEAPAGSSSPAATQVRYSAARSPVLQLHTVLSEPATRCAHTQYTHRTTVSVVHGFVFKNCLVFGLAGRCAVPSCSARGTPRTQLKRG